MTQKHPRERTIKLVSCGSGVWFTVLVQYFGDWDRRDHSSCKQCQQLKSVGLELLTVPKGWSERDGKQQLALLGVHHTGMHSSLAFIRVSLASFSSSLPVSVIYCWTILILFIEIVCFPNIAAFIHPCQLLWFYCPPRNLWWFCLSLAFWNPLCMGQYHISHMKKDKMLIQGLCRKVWTTSTLKCPEQIQSIPHLFFFFNLIFNDVLFFFRGIVFCFIFCNFFKPGLVILKA